MIKQEKQKKLDELKKSMEEDKSLPLRTKETNLVFGAGNPATKILFIGEGPGYWENQKRVPFVGNAGALLNQLLISIGIKREEVYITNVVHHRPPGNRDPEPDEIIAYKPYLDKIIEIINPTLIVTLGRFSMAKFLGSVTISTVHGNEKKVDWKERSLWVIPMYHPAAGLRNGEIKRRLFEDFKRIPEVLKISQEKSDNNPGISKEIEKVDNSEQMSLI